MALFGPDGALYVQVGARASRHDTADPTRAEALGPGVLLSAPLPVDDSNCGD